MKWNYFYVIICTGMVRPPFLNLYWSKRFLCQNQFISSRIPNWFFIFLQYRDNEGLLESEDRLYQIIKNTFNEYTESLIFFLNTCFNHQVDLHEYEEMIFFSTLIVFWAYSNGLATHWILKTTEMCFSYENSISGEPMLNLGKKLGNIFYSCLFVRFW